MRITCPECSAHYDLGEEMRGAKVQCPACDTKFFIYEDGSVHPVPKEAPAGSKQPASSVDELKQKTALTHVTTLDKGQIGPFVLKHVPSYNPADGQRLSEALWKPNSTTTTTIRSPKHGIFLILSKVSQSPTALGAALSFNQKGWVSIPPELLARMIKPDKPVSEQSQANLKQFYRNLSSRLYEDGEYCGIIQFDNGNAMGLDVKEDPEHLDTLLFKTTFLQKKSYNVMEFDGDTVSAWPPGAAVQTVSHGKARSDGWSAFNIVSHGDGAP